MPTREGIVKEALEWLETPWRHRQRCKGAGVDCAQFIGGVGVNSGCFLEQSLRVVPVYTSSWQLHKTDEKFANTLRKLGFIEIEKGSQQKSDVLLFQYGRACSHGGILIAQDKIIHVPRDYPSKVHISKLDYELRGRLRMVFQFPNVEN